MWFKQLTLFRIESGQIPTAAELNQKLLGGIFTPCLGLDWFSEGFTAPFPDQPKNLVFNTPDCMAVVLKREDKVLPKSVIMEAVRKRITAIRNSEDRKVGRREQAEIQEAVIDNMLPRAFCKISQTDALIHTTDNLLLINTASASKAGDFLGRLREVMGGFYVTLPKTRKAPEILMTEWLQNGYCAGRFDLDSDSTLRGHGRNAPTIKASKQDLTAEEISRLVNSDKTVKQLGLIWDGRLAFILTESLSIKRIHYTDSLIQDAEEKSRDNEQNINEEMLRYASQTIMTATLTEMLQELVGLLDGFDD